MEPTQPVFSLLWKVSGTANTQTHTLTHTTHTGGYPVSCFILPKRQGKSSWEFVLPPEQRTASSGLTLSESLLKTLGTHKCHLPVSNHSSESGHLLKSMLMSFFLSPN